MLKWPLEINQITGNIRMATGNKSNNLSYVSRHAELSYASRHAEQ